MDFSQSRSLASTVHYVFGDNVQDPRSTYDGAGEDDSEKALIVQFY